MGEKNENEEREGEKEERKVDEITRAERIFQDHVS